MKKTISFFTKGKALVGGLLLTGAFLFGFSGSASAQQMQNANGTANPYGYVGEKLDVVAYPLGTFDRGHSMDVLQNIVNSLQGTVGNGGGTQSQKAKYTLAKGALVDIRDRYIATEIALLTNLNRVNEEKSTVGIDPSVLATVYNQVVAQLQ